MHCHFVTLIILSDLHPSTDHNGYNTSWVSFSYNPCNFSIGLRIITNTVGVIKVEETPSLTPKQMTHIGVKGVKISSKVWRLKVGIIIVSHFPAVCPTPPLVLLQQLHLFGDSWMMMSPHYAHVKD